MSATEPITARVSRPLPFQDSHRPDFSTLSRPSAPHISTPLAFTGTVPTPSNIMSPIRIRQDLGAQTISLMLPPPLTFLDCPYLPPASHPYPKIYLLCLSPKLWEARSFVFLVVILPVTDT